MKQASIVFLFNLLQDVNIVRPLIYMARRELGAEIVLLVTSKFLERDKEWIWQHEIAQMRADTDASLYVYQTPLEAFAVLQGRHGFLIAASESNLSGHADTHNVFRIAPSSFVKITLQHGFECVGFLQNREHNIAHGRNVTFAADVICGWCEAPALTALVPSQRPKLYVSGPSSVLHGATQKKVSSISQGGIVCENLHSVRLRATGNFGVPFMDVFQKFCAIFDDYGLPITLRPHPGGQYVLKNKVTLPRNVLLNNLPVYKSNLQSYQFGISAPSTILIDMLLAGIPAAVWHDSDGIMDFGNYEGLTEISTLDDWLAFARDTILRRSALLASQKDFLDRLAMPTNPDEVYSRFARLLATRADGPNLTDVTISSAHTPKRVLFIANGLIPTLQLSFLKPLESLIHDGRMVIEVVTEQDLIGKFGREIGSPEAGLWLEHKIRGFAPNLVVCCRYSGPHPDVIIRTSHDLQAAVVFHIDDDLLNIPPEIGLRKYQSHNRPNRLKTVDMLIRTSDLVYCSTLALKRRLRELGYSSTMVNGSIYCAGTVLSHSENRPVVTVGYMGFDHAHDLDLILPSLVQYLLKHTQVCFELFGSIPLPDVLLQFGDRVVVVPPVANYNEFLLAFAQRRWDIGLIPLAQTPFNAVKANTKWVEYTSVGAAVVATKGMAYDDCCADGCGILAKENEWSESMELLTDNQELRFRMVQAAQARLTSKFSPGHLHSQIMAVFEKARLIFSDAHQRIDVDVLDGDLKSWAEKSVQYFNGQPTALPAGYQKSAE